MVMRILTTTGGIRKTNRIQTAIPSMLNQSQRRSSETMSRNHLIKVLIICNLLLQIVSIVNYLRFALLLALSQLVLQLHLCTLSLKLQVLNIS